MSKNMYKQTPKEKKLPIQDRFQEVMDAFNRSNNYVSSHLRENWSENVKLYNNERTNIQYLGSSDIFVPETFTILQTIKANVLGGDPQVAFLPTRSDQNADTKVLSKMVDFIWEEDGMDMKLDLCVDDMLSIGNSYLFTFWDSVKKIPSSKYFNAQDCFFDISVGRYEDMRFCGYRYLTTKKKLEESTITNPSYVPGETGQDILVKRYKNLEQVKSINSYSSDKLAKAEKEEMLIGAQYNDPDAVEVICYIDKERMISVANRRVVIEDTETPFKRDAFTIESVDNMGQPVPVEVPEIEPFLPFAPFRNYIDGDLWYARSEIDVIKDLQERLNDVKTQKFDNLAMVLDKLFTLDPAYADRVEEVVSVPGAVLTFPAGALQEIPITSVGRDADDEIESLRNDMQRATAADELMQGQTADSTMTATEVRAQIAQAGTRFNRKLKQISSEGLRIWAHNIFKMIQIYVDQEIAVRMIGPEGAEWQDYNPGEYLGDYEPTVMLEAEVKAKNEEEKQNAMQFYLLASKQPFVDQQKLFVETGMNIFGKSEEDMQNMILPPAPPMMMGPDGMPMGEGMGDDGTMPIDNSIPGGMPAAEGLPTDGEQMNMAGMPTA